MASLQNNCERVIVGSRVMKSLLNDEDRKETLKIIEQLSKVCEV